MWNSAELNLEKAIYTGTFKIKIWEKVVHINHLEM
jgi:hypothetical protein